MDAAIRLICGEDRDCAEETSKLPSFFRELDGKILRIPIPALDPSTRPLASSVPNSDGLYRKAMRLAGGEPELAQYIVKRRIYMAAPRDLKGEGTTCPVCGDRPTMLVLRKYGFGGIFSGFRQTAKCICGMEWDYPAWACPHCGNTDRMKFTVYLYGPLEFRRCDACGFTLPVIEADAGDDVHYIHPVLLLAARHVEGD